MALGAEPFLCSVENTQWGALRAGQAAAPLWLFSLVVFIRCGPWVFPRRVLLAWLWGGEQQPRRGADSPSPTPVLAFAVGVLSWLERTSDFPAFCLLKQNPLQAGAVPAAASRSRELPSTARIQTLIFGMRSPADPPASTGWAEALKKRSFESVAFPAHRISLPARPRTERRVWFWCLRVLLLFSEGAVPDGGAPACTQGCRMEQGLPSAFGTPRAFTAGNFSAP